MVSGYYELTRIDSVAIPWFVVPTMSMTLAGFGIADLADHRPPGKNVHRGAQGQIKNGWRGTARRLVRSEGSSVLDGPPEANKRTADTPLKVMIPSPQFPTAHLRSQFT